MNEIDYQFKIWIFNPSYSYDFILGQITIGKKRITNDQELPRIINIG